MKSDFLLRNPFSNCLKLFIIILGIYFSPITTLTSSHIQGGHIYYECLGNGINSEINRYRIIVESYVDCPGNNIEEIAIEITRGDSTYSLLFVPLDSTEIIVPPDYECVNVPNNICLLKASYIVEVDLPKIDTSYFIVQQLCCRAQNVANIISSFEVGFTYFVEISSLSQQLQNSSPRITALPPSLVCVNETINLSFAESDQEGNQIVYKLCNPLDSDINSGTSIFSLPPYPSVPFVLPEYNFLNPLGQNAIFILNPNSGMATIKPSTVGHFVVGICIEEYQNGQLLSSLTRDILFNVVPCVSHTEILIESAIEISHNIFHLNFCDTNVYSINNLRKSEFQTKCSFNTIIFYFVNALLLRTRFF